MWRTPVLVYARKKLYPELHPRGFLRDVDSIADTSQWVNTVYYQCSGILFRHKKRNEVVIAKDERVWNKVVMTGICQRQRLLSVSHPAYSKLKTCSQDRLEGRIPSERCTICPEAQLPFQIELYVVCLPLRCWCSTIYFLLLSWVSPGLALENLNYSLSLATFVL